MSKVKKNLMDLALRQELINAIIYTYENNIEISKTVKNFIKYDSMTHTFILEFTNGTIQELSDKLVFDVELVGEELIIQDKKPNDKRANNK